MNQPPFGPGAPQVYRSNAPPPPFAPSREAMEAERLAKEARDRRLANDELVITIYRACGLIAVGIGILLFFVSARSGSMLAGKIVLRTIVFGGTGGGLFARGNALARRRAQLTPEYPMMPTHPPPLPPPPQTQVQEPPAAQPGQITRWTD